MNVQMIMALCILVFMVVMLLTHVLPYGVTGMICCVLFVFTGVLDLKTAFSGLSSSTTLMIAPMIVVATALGKTSLIHRLRGVMSKLQGKSGAMLVLGLCGMTILLSQLMGQVACISVMLLFIQTFDDDSELFPVQNAVFSCNGKLSGNFQIPDRHGCYDARHDHFLLSGTCWSGGLSGNC